MMSIKITAAKNQKITRTKPDKHREKMYLQLNVKHMPVASPDILQTLHSFRSISFTV